MTIANELLTSTAVLALFVGILGYFIRRWMERIEEKVDAIMDYRTTAVTRDECSRKTAKLHERFDKHIDDSQEVASRIANLEGRVR